MKVRTRNVDLTTRHPFGISRSSHQQFRNVIVEIDHDGRTGIGEAAPSRYYGETRDTIAAVMPLLEQAIGEDPFCIEEISSRLTSAIGRNPAAKAAVDIALYDLIGKLLNVPVYRLLGLNPNATPCTSYTISLGDSRLVEAKLLEASAFPVLKVKVGGPDDEKLLDRIRTVTDKVIRIDANGAWGAKEAIRRIQALSEFGIEFVEQPVDPSDIDGLRFVRECVDVPVFADESAVTPEDLEGLAGVVDGINIKLMKCGGILPALKMIRTARSLHMKVMLGCMIESSVAITAAAHLSPLVDYADLDGNLLIDNDPYRGVTVTGGRLMLSDRPGLGIESADHAA